MLNIHGVVRIPNECNLAVTPYKGGAYFSFKVFSQDAHQKSYYYNCSMFIPTEEISIWEEKVKPGNIFIIEFANIDSFTKDDWNMTYHTVKLQRQHFKLMKVKPAGEKVG